MTVPDILDSIQEQPAVTLRKFDDIDAQRQAIYDRALVGVRAAFDQLESRNKGPYGLKLQDAYYGHEKAFSLADEKKALMTSGRLHRPLKGRIQLYDRQTGKTLDEQETILAHIPHLTSRGVFIHNGVAQLPRNQARLVAGIYGRRRNDGSAEVQFNTRPGSGRGFRIGIDPEKGVFNLEVGQSTTRLYPILRSLGYSDKKLVEAWGPELFKANWRAQSGRDMEDLKKVLSKLGRPEDAEAEDPVQRLREIIEKQEFDEDATELTFKERIKKNNVDMLVRAATRARAILRAEDPGDNRDSQAFQSVLSAEDIIEERLRRDPGQHLRKLLWKAQQAGTLGKLKSGLLTPNIHAIYNGSGLIQVPEDINPLEIYDLRQGITRLGEGGIANEQSVSRDARGVQPSYLGLIDPARAPESGGIGLDLRVTDYTYKGSDGRLYAEVRDPRTGALEKLSSVKLASAPIALPGQFNTKQRKVVVIHGEEMKYMDRDQVKYELPSAARMTSRGMNMIPFSNAAKSQRILMGARMLSQALPLVESEAPFVQSADEDGESFYRKIGRYAGAVEAQDKGRVVSVSPTEIVVQYANGEKKSHELYDSYPGARKTELYNTALVKPGDVVKPGQVLARSNFTDRNGTLAVGRNLRVAYLAGEGATFEDSIVISESAAKKLASEHSYKVGLDLDKSVRSTAVKDYVSAFPDTYQREQLEKMDKDGVVKIGAVVKPGDPLVLGVGTREKRALGTLAKKGDLPVNLAQEWDHDFDGVVTDVARTRSGIQVRVRSREPMTVGSKLSARYGNKGVVSKVVPDAQMPVDSQGRPIEVMMSPIGVISRVNPNVLIETLLGKITEKTGKIYKPQPFERVGDAVEWALEEAKKHGISEMDVLEDQRDGRKISGPDGKGVFTGVQFLMRLHHTAESKMSARSQGGYGYDDTPAKGGYDGSKRVALLDSYSLLSHGARGFLSDAKLVRGQRNDEYWRALRAGQDVAPPSTGVAHKHFLSQLKAAGINVREKSGGRLQVAPMSDADVDAMGGQEITTAGTFNYETMEPIKGGLFDLEKTGGADGNQWSFIRLGTKIPNPIMEEPVARLLGITKSRLEGVLAGTDELDGGGKGPEAVEKALAKIDVDKAIAAEKTKIRSGKPSTRDAAIKSLNYLVGLKTAGLKPTDLLISKLPVIPPKYRPILRTKTMDMVNDANYLYGEILAARDNYQEASKEFGAAPDEYSTLYKAVKALTGLGTTASGDLEERGVSGLLKNAIGVGQSPKYSRFQRKVIGQTVDNVGRGVITADPDLDMDQIAIPEEMAWTLYEPYIVRGLRQMGVGAREAIQLLEKRDSLAKKVLDEEMRVRPVAWNRAPSLHRFNYLGAWPTLSKGKNIGVPPPVTGPQNADFDGDAVNVHVPSTYEAIEDLKEKMMPSKNLRDVANFDILFKPNHEFLAGLHLATRPREGKTVRTFATREDAKKAYLRGDLRVSDPIVILEK